MPARFYALVSLVRRLVVAASATCVVMSAATAANGSRPLKIIQTTDLRLRDALDPDIPAAGEVRFVALVTEQGKLEDLMLLGSTHRAFTQAAVEGLQEWTFEPAQEHGRPIGVRTTLRIFFETHGRVVSVHGAQVLRALIGRSRENEFPSRLAQATELDRPLQADRVVQPRFPDGYFGRIIPRTAVLLDFYVDETGRVRMPVAVRSPDPRLTLAAIDALDEWHFEPPMRDGQPVIVRARQEFVFFDSTAAGDS